MDSVDARAADEWLVKLAHELDGRRPDYLVISHMEPDHSGSILRLAERYPEMQLVGNAKTFAMLRQFFGAKAPADDRLLEVGEGRDALPWGAHASFYARPDGSLAGGDGRLRGNREAPLLRRRLRALRLARAHRQRAVGTAGTTLLLQHCRQVRRAGTGTAEKGVRAGDRNDLPLHGPVLTGEALGEALRLYDLWSRWQSESPDDILLAHASIHGNTARAAELLKQKLEAKGSAGHALRPDDDRGLLRGGERLLLR